LRARGRAASGDGSFTVEGCARLLRCGYAIGSRALRSHAPIPRATVPLRANLRQILRGTAARSRRPPGAGRSRRPALCLSPGHARLQQLTHR
jgi:hypothetical protein